MRTETNQTIYLIRDASKYGNPSDDVVTTTLPEGLRIPTEAELETDWYAFSSMPKFVYRGEISQEALAEGTTLGDMCGELIGVIG